MAKNDFDLDFDFEKEYGFDPKAILDSEYSDEDLDLSQFDDEALGIDLSEESAGSFDDFDLDGLDLGEDTPEIPFERETWKEPEETASFEEEEDLIRAGMLKPAQVLKVGHHGDNKATSQALLRIVQPKVAVILTHSFEEQDTPSIAALRRLNDAGCAYIVSQNVHDAILVTLDQGAVNVADISWGHVPAVPEGLTLSLNLANDLAIIENTGASPVNLEGMRLYSSKGKDTLTLPAYILAPGEQYFIGSRSTKGDYHLLFDKKRVWHESKRDMAILYDPYGRALFRTDNGFKE